MTISLELDARLHHPESQRAVSSGKLDASRGSEQATSDEEHSTLPELLDDWARQSDHQHPLLLLAPFGMGKSAALARLAVRLADQLLRDLADESTPLRVPMPVRLRALLEFTPPAGNRPFLRFMHHAQSVLDPDAAGALDWETFEELARRNMLVPLLDGFDELPGSYESNATISRSSVFRSIQATCGEFFVLTSRPGYEAENLIGDAYQYVIDELTPGQIKEFIARKFANNAVRQEAASGAFHTHQARLALLLRRPLFLAIWCDLVPRDGSNPPRTIDALMTELIVRCFDKRQASIQRTRWEIIERLPELGALLAIFADEGFDANLDLSDLRARFAGTGNHALLQQTIELALAAGFMVRTGETLWYALKMPVVEYLIGKYLAEQGSRPDQLHGFLEKFRRWVWQPALHDVLDYTFEALWAGSAAQQVLAESLLEWLIEVGRHDLTYSDAIEPYVTVDLLRPLAASVLRWYGASDRQRHEGVISAASQLARSVRLLAEQESRLGELLQGPPLTSALVELAVEQFGNVLLHSTVETSGGCLELLTE